MLLSNAGNVSLIDPVRKVHPVGVIKSTFSLNGKFTGVDVCTAKFKTNELYGRYPGDEESALTNFIGKGKELELAGLMFQATFSLFKEKGISTVLKNDDNCPVSAIIPWLLYRERTLIVADFMTLGGFNMKTFIRSEKALLIDLTKETVIELSEGFTKQV